MGEMAVDPPSARTQGRRCRRTDEKPWLLPDQIAYKFVNATIIDPEGGREITGSVVTIAEGRIQSVNVAASGHSLKAEDEHDFVQVEQDMHEFIEIDLRGKYICPGLIDSHVHVTATPGETSLKATYKNIPQATNHYRTTFLANEMLGRGFTTARDCGGADASLKDAISEWIIPGPRLLISGHALSQSGGHGDQRDAHIDEDPTTKCCGGHAPGIGRLCDGVTGCSVAVRDEMRKGADFIKIMGGGGVASRLNNLEHVQFLEEELQAITRTAASFKTYVTAHAYSVEAIRHCIDNGVRGIEHGNFIDPETAKYMADKGVAMTPTLVTYNALSSPPFRHFLSDSCQDKNLNVMKRGLESIKIAEEAGVTLLFGSDLLAGMHRCQSHEFSLRATVQSNLSILRSATVNPARWMGLEQDIGEIKPGRYADLLILNKNPLEDISILDDRSTFLAIIKEGRVFKSELPTVPVDIVKEPW